MKAQLDLDSLAMVGNEYLNRHDGVMASESSSSDLSELQKEYRKFFKGLVAEEGFENSPFEGSEEEMRDFFQKIKARWTQRKKALVEEGTLTKEQANL